MPRYETYQASGIEAPSMRRWILLGLVLSLGLHGGLFYYFTHEHVEGFSVGTDRPAASRIFKLKQVSIPAIPAEQHLSMTEKGPNMAKLTLPSEKPVLTEVHVAPQITELPKQFLSEKPRVDAAAMENLAKVEANSRSAIDRDLNSLAQNLIKEGPHMPRQPKLVVGGSKLGGGPGEGDANLAIPGMATVDDLLDQTGSLKTGAKAGMPGGALFDYDRYELLPDSVEALRKLAMLIQQNPRATFSIEGHSDAIGSPEYNQKLSLLRAEAVKTWLVQTMAIAPERIQTKGFGSSKLIVSAEHTKEQQAPNRRVEIVVKTNRR